MQLVRGIRGPGGRTDGASEPTEKALSRAEPCATGTDDAGAPRPAAAGGCSSRVEVALLDADAGDLTDLRRAALKAHLRRCGQCQRSLGEIRQARRELLGDSPVSTNKMSTHAAAEIQRILCERAARPPVPIRKDADGEDGALPAA